MSHAARILVQLDPDPQASLFDAVVAVDSDVDRLLQYRHVEPAQVRDLVHGAIFTRKPEDLNRTAIFVGGSDVDRGERLLDQVVGSFFGPMRVSVMMDSNGANTTAAAAVLGAARHIDLDGSTATVLAATGPVGQRAVRLLAQEGATVRVVSRQLERAESICGRIEESAVAGTKGTLVPVEVSSPDSLFAALDSSVVVIAAGAAGVELLPRTVLDAISGLRVAIDLNAVPPLGIAGVNVTDKADVHADVICYGAIGVGGMKMRIHKAAIRSLFERNDLVLDIDEIFAIGTKLE